MKTILIALLLFAAVPANACINESEPFEEEHRADYGQSPVEFLREQLDAQPSSKIVGPKSGQLISPDLDTEFVTSQHDAVSEIYSGNFKVAIEKLQALEASHPNDYRTAANLGTAYELIGDNKNALHWISEGIKRDEDSHHGTEWLHKQILEAKITMESDPDYLRTNHILPIEKSVARYTSSYADNLDRALHYQLGERMLFVKPLDPVVADLLYSFAIVEFQSGAPGAAIELLKLAQESEIW